MTDTQTLDLPKTARSTLYGKACRLLGGVYQPHPTPEKQKAGWHIHVTLYRIGHADQFCVCIAEGNVQADAATLKEALGQTIDGKLIARFAQRYHDGLKFAELKADLERHVKGDWYWYGKAAKR